MIKEIEEITRELVKKETYSACKREALNKIFKDEGVDRL